ncbi:MAG: cell division protein ZapA [Spirochaetae bacterium HGW-Spirochaetae-7]|jgi:cell division protein ZapA (FtsZ GTPase activity inhibitor)|nr:MAG: cell division protein ZapA [Spirochaetae bacterium HGW-Spirochaetae-7]
MAIETVRVELLGASFTIQTDESKEYVESLLAYLGSKIETVKASSKVDDPLKASILAGIFLVDELYRERVDASTHSSQAEPDVDIGAVAERLITRIDETLSDTKSPSQIGGNP